MRKRINTDELEDYLKDVADGHRMYPSNQIWSNIRENLHGNPRWPALTFISLFIITSLVIGTIFIKPDETILKHLAAKPVAAVTAEQKPDYADAVNPSKLTSGTFERIRRQSVAVIDTTSVPVLAFTPVDLEIIARTPEISVLNVTSKIVAPESSIDLTVFTGRALNTEIISEEKNSVIETKEVSPKPAEITPSALSLIETVVIPKIAKKSKWEFGFYIAPSSSFRRISDDNRTKTASNLNILPATSNSNIDVNQVIRHKPAMGVEAGFSFGYQLTSQLKLRAGLQLNIRQYNIDAYGSATELVRLAVNNGARIDTINTISNFRNNNGYYETTLKNKYHEISLPVGIEWSNTISKRLSWGAAASIQPTYVFSKQAFVISNDYKNYAANVPLFRNWNLNTGVEAFLSYKAGNYTWRLGPQVRYQQLSSYSQKYPIKENLYDYGVKFGFIKTIK